jgi:hypothetical protein
MAPGCDERARWRPEPRPGDMFGDRLLSEAANREKGALTADAGGGEARIAFPIDDRRAFPMMPAFCLGRPEFIDGREYLVFNLRSGEGY